MAGRLIRAGDALSQLFNVIIFNGDSNYSISGDAYRYQRKWLMTVIDWLASPWEQDHCASAYFNDVQKAHQLAYEAEHGTV